MIIRRIYSQNELAFMLANAAVKERGINYASGKYSIELLAATNADGVIEQARVEVTLHDDNGVERVES